METSGGMRLGDLMKPARVKLNLTGLDRDAVLQELVDVIPEVQQVPAAREKLLKALHEREQLHSTGIGDGVALPHARNAFVGLVDKPVIVFGRHTDGIAYAAIDGKPARLFFLLVAPSVTQHLAMLARISRVLRDPKMRQNLLAARTVNEVIEVIAKAEAKMYGD